ncbi:MAG: biopolymer transporter ExbD [Phycisphaerales bacterium]
MIRARTLDSTPSLDLTPIVDMVFLLLIFFLAATTFQQTEREMTVALPSASAAVPISAALREIVVNVDQEGRIVIGGRATTGEELASLVKGAVAGNPEQKVSVRGDRRAAYEHIVAVLDICKAAGIQEPYLDTLQLRD